MKARKRVVTSVDRPARWPPAGRSARPGGMARPGGTVRPAGMARPAGQAPAPAPTGRELRVPEAAASIEPQPLDLTVDLGRGLLLRSPLVIASGAAGYGLELDDVLEVEGLGAICTRGTTLRARTGNRPPRMTRAPAGLLNSVGLHNPGLEAVLDRYAEGWARWPVPVILNLAAESSADFVELARRLDGVPGVAGIELNLSCPNTARGGTLFALEPEAAGAVTGAVRRASDLPLLVKLSPAAPDPRAMARAVADAGADAISAVNTLPALAVSPARDRPLLGGTTGGLSGPALRPVALRVVHEVVAAASVPVVAMGGVTSVEDVLDFLAVGAAAVGVATAAIGDPRLPARLSAELAAICASRGLDSHRPLVGTAVDRWARPASRGIEYRP